MGESLALLASGDPDAPWRLGHSPQAAPACLSASLLSGHLFLDWVHPNLEGSHLEILYCTHKDSFFKRDHTHRFCLVKSFFGCVGSSLWHLGSSCRGAQALECAGSGVAKHRLRCPTACGILVPQPGIKPASLQWKADSQPLDHQGSPRSHLLRVCPPHDTL